MRKLLMLFGAVLLSLTGLTARAQSGSGQLTAYCYYWVTGSGWKAYGDLQLEVTGTYQSNFKSLNISTFNIPGHTSYTNNMILTLDPATGNVSRTDCLAYKYYQSDQYPAYYADFTDNELTAPHVITGKLENTGVNESTLTLSTWSDLQCEDYGKKNQYFNQGKWENTKIVFTFAIPDLPAYEETDPEPSGDVNYMTANYYKPDGQFVRYDNVTGVYDDQKRTLTLNNVADKAEYPLVFNVDEEGNLVSNPWQLSLFAEGLEMYYSDIIKENCIVYGTVENGEKTSTIKLNNFGDFVAEYGMFFSEWYNTVIVLDHRIEYAEAEPEFPETTWVVNGNYNDNSSWSTPIKFTSYANGVYSTDKIDKLVEFKLTNENVWYGYDGEGYAPLGKTFKVAAGDQYGNVAFGLSGYVENAVINFNPETLEVSVDGNWVSTALTLYLRGGMNNWGNSGLTKADEFNTMDGKVYTITRDKIEAGVEFKIASDSWSPEYTTSNTSMSNGTYNITGSGNMALAQTMTNVTLTLDIDKKTLTVQGTEEGFVPLYLRGDMNGWGTSDDWKFSTENGVDYTLKVASIQANAQFKIADGGWNVENTYTYKGRINPNKPYTLENLTGDQDNMIMGVTVNDATVTYNRDTHEFEITGTVVMPDLNIPDVLFMLGNVNDLNWSTSQGVPAANNNGVFTFSKVTVNESDANGVGYFSFVTKLGDSWDDVNEGDRFGATDQNETVELGEAMEVVFYPVNVSADGALSWQIVPGTYNFVVDLNELTLTVSNLPNELELNFKAVGFELDPTEINDYVTVVDQYAQFMLEEDGVLNIDKNPYTYTYVADQSYMSLAFTPAEGYELDITLSNVPEGAEIEPQTGSTGEWMIMGGNIGRGAVANITITKLPDNLILNFIGTNIDLKTSEINNYVTVVDQYAQFMLEEDGVLNIDENPYIYSYVADQEFLSLMFTPTDGYELNITLENKPEDAEIEVQSGDTDIWMIVGGEIGRGIIANIAITETDYAEAYLGVSSNGVPTAPNEDYPLELNNGTFTGTYTIEAGQNINIWVKTGNDDVELLAVPVSKYRAYGPADAATEWMFSNATTSITSNVTANNVGYWTLDNDEDLEITFSFNPTAGTVTAENETTIAPEGSYVAYDDDLVFRLPDNNTEPQTFRIPLSIYGEEFTYAGFQFDITLPAELTFKGIELDNELFGSEPVYNEVNGNTRVMWKTGTPGEGYEVRENFATILVEAAYADGMTTHDVNVALTNVIFSPITGVDDIRLENYNGTITIEVEHVPDITDIIITSVELAMPSYDFYFNTDPKSQASVTTGENLILNVKLMDGTVDKEDSGFVTWTPNIVSFGNGVYTVNTSGYDAEETITLEGVCNGSSAKSVTYTFTVRPVISGDANDNGAVTVSDVVTTANYIMALTDPKLFGDLLLRFDFPNGDVTGDNEIDSDDIVAITNMILGRNGMNRRNAGSMDVNDVLVVDDFTVALNKPFEIGVGLDNSRAYTALQAVVEIPQGMNVIGVTKGNRASAHDMVYNVQADGNVAVVLFSRKNEAFAEGEGQLFNVLVTANENAGNVTVKRIHASDDQTNGYYLGVEGGNNQSLVTGIYDLSEDVDGDVRFYTVDGIEVRNPQKGQIVIRVQNGKAVKEVVK